MSVVASLDSLPAEERLTFLHEAARQVVYDDPDRALGIGYLSLKEAREQQDPAATSVAFMDIGLAYYFSGDYHNALRNYQESLAIARDLNDKFNMANAYNNIGVLYFVWGEHDKALDYYFRALAIRLDMDDVHGIGQGYNNVANIYHTGFALFINMC